VKALPSTCGSIKKLLTNNLNSCCTPSIIFSFPCTSLMNFVFIFILCSKNSLKGKSFFFYLIFKAVLMINNLTRAYNLRSFCDLWYNATFLSNLIYLQYIHVLTFILVLCLPERFCDLLVSVTTSKVCKKLSLFGITVYLFFMQNCLSNKRLIPSYLS